MKYDHVVIRFGELNTKGKNKKIFIDKLYRNIKRQLKDFETLEYIKTRDRIFIILNDENHDNVKNVISKVFGIQSFSLALKVENDIDKIEIACLTLLKDTNKTTFKVITKRHDKRFFMNSDQVNRHIGGVVLKNTDLKVDVHNPEIPLKIEIHEQFTYISFESILGAGGYPVGVGAKALLMLSGGIDSPVAGYLLMKRGVVVECIHFASPPYTSERAKQKVLDLAKSLTEYCINIKVHVIHFTKIQMAIVESVDPSYQMTIMRRMMCRIAERVANQNNCKAIATGESIGQVASQTIESMQTINAVTNMPILRPAVCLDKLEIIALAKKINTYETSIRPYEDCCTLFIPSNPATKPKIEKAEIMETYFPYEELITEALENIEIITVDKTKEDNQNFF